MADRPLQIEEETKAFLKTFGDQQAAVATATASGDFMAVPIDPYQDQPQGPEGYPNAEKLTELMVGAYQDPEGGDINGKNMMSLQQQLALLDGYRKAYTARRMRRSGFSKQLVYEQQTTLPAALQRVARTLILNPAPEAST